MIVEHWERGPGVKAVKHPGFPDQCPECAPKREVCSLCGTYSGPTMPRECEGNRDTGHTHYFVPAPTPVHGLVPFEISEESRRAVLAAAKELALLAEDQIPNVADLDRCTAAYKVITDALGGNE